MVVVEFGGSGGRRGGRGGGKGAGGNFLGNFGDRLERSRWGIPLGGIPRGICLEDLFRKIPLRETPFLGVPFGGDSFG